MYSVWKCLLSLLWLCHGDLSVGGELSGAPPTWWCLSLRKWVPYLCNKATTSMKVYLVYIVGVSPSIHRVQKLLSLASFMAFLEHYCTDGNLSKARTGISFSINIKKKKKKIFPDNNKPGISAWYIFLMKKTLRMLVSWSLERQKTR